MVEKHFFSIVTAKYYFQHSFIDKVWELWNEGSNGVTLKDVHEIKFSNRVVIYFIFVTFVDFVQGIKEKCTFFYH